MTRIVCDLFRRSRSITTIDHVRLAWPISVQQPIIHPPQDLLAYALAVKTSHGHRCGTVGGHGSRVEAFVLATYWLQSRCLETVAKLRAVDVRHANGTYAVDHNNK